MIKMTIYRADIHSDYPVPVTAQIDLRYPLAGYVHVGRRFWTTIDLETGLSYGIPAATLKECGPIVADRYDKVQEIKKNPKNRAGWMEPRFRAVREMINKDNNIDLYNHLEKYVEVSIGNVNRCVCCGEIIPEGRQVCPICEGGKK